MKRSRIGLLALVVLGWSLFQPMAQAEVWSLRPDQTLTPPANTSYDNFGVGVAIDGPYLIVLAIASHVGSNTYAALLYRRSLSTGQWVYRKTLLTRDGAFARFDVEMKSGIAVIQSGGQVSLFEHSNGDYVPARTAAPIVHPGGVAISASRVLIGGNGCDDDGIVYEKRADGVWDVSGRLDDNAGDCVPEGLWVELNYNYALVRSTQDNTVAKAWRRPSSGGDWIAAGTLASPPNVFASPQPWALQGNTGVANNGYSFVRSGTTWTSQGRATAVDNDNGDRVTFETVYRDGVLVTSESGPIWAFPRIYVETSPGRFEHVGSLLTSRIANELDVSGRTVVVGIADFSTPLSSVEVFTLPEQLHAPAPVVNDFEDRDVSDFEVRSGQFQLATRGTDDVYAQGSASGFAVALATQSDWSGYQRVEADILPTYGLSDGWVGLVARYIDPANYYFAGVHPNGTFAIYKKVNGINTLLKSGGSIAMNPRHVSLVVEGDELRFGIDNNNLAIANDSSLSHGRAGLASWHARSDFDDVRITNTAVYALFYREWGPYGSQYDIDLATAGGQWQVAVDEEGNSQGLMQLDKTGDARAYIGTPVANQDIHARMHLDSFGTSQNGAWFGLLARYVDPQNHYYATVRSTGQIQIRKIVNGVITVLASAAFVPTPGDAFDLQFLVVDDQLQLSVNGTLMATAHDSDIAGGRYGIATYRTAATFENLAVQQP